MQILTEFSQFSVDNSFDRYASGRTKDQTLDDSYGSQRPIAGYVYHYKYSPIRLTIKNSFIYTIMLTLMIYIINNPLQ